MISELPEKSGVDIFIEYLLWTRHWSCYFSCLNFIKSPFTNIHEVGGFNLHFASEERQDPSAGSSRRVNNLPKILRLQSSRSGFEQKPVLLPNPFSLFSCALQPRHGRFPAKTGWKMEGQSSDWGKGLNG